MGITHFLDKTVQIRRLSRVQGFKTAYSATASVQVHIQQASEEKASLLQGSFGRTYLAWVTLDNPVTITEEDRLRDERGREFIVKTINRRDFGINQHMELILERLDNKGNS